MVKLPTDQRVCCKCGVIIRQRFQEKSRTAVMDSKRIFCNVDNRSCLKHFEKGYFSEEAVALMQFTHGDNECLINMLTDRVVALEENCKISDFYNENMNVDDCKCSTGLSKAQFATVV
ncbi:hypothetical protein JTB14_025975 [Gonioctena quinquepunctata]|nr:hypothetical protein JTB14_025975 [Gonioctena quinquepunctata]